MDNKMVGRFLGRIFVQQIEASIEFSRRTVSDCRSRWWGSLYTASQKSIPDIFNCNLKTN